MPFDILAQKVGFLFAACCKSRIATPLSEAGKLNEHVMQEESQPDTLAAPVEPNQIHSIVPVPATHQRKAMLAEPQAMHESPRAMFVQTCDLFGTNR